MLDKRYTPRIQMSPPRPGQILLRRLLILVMMLVGILALFWFERDGLKDNLDGQLSFTDVLYFTAVTISTVGYGDIVPVSETARLLDAAVVTPLRLLMWFIFLGTAYELVLQRWLEQFRMKLLQKNLENHLVICGYGHSGQSAASEAVAKGTDHRQIIILDRDKIRLDLAVEAGFIGIYGDACQIESLKNCNIERARAILVCVGRDDSTALAVLTIRQISKQVRIICNVEQQENASLIYQAGANTTITPAVVGGFLMANSISSPRVADYVNDLISATGQVQLVERPATEREIGKLAGELHPNIVVRVYRGHDAIGFWEGERARIQKGDMLMEIRATRDAN